MENKSGFYVMKLPHQPGCKESRYAHLLGGEISVGDSSNAEPGR